MKVKVRRVEIPKPTPKPEFLEPYYGDVLARPDCPEDQWRFAEKCPTDAPFYTRGECLQQKHFPHPLMTCQCPYHGDTYLLNITIETSFTFANTRLVMACGCRWKDAGKLSGFYGYGWTRDEDVEEIALVRKRMEIVTEEEAAATPRPKPKPPLPKPKLAVKQPAPPKPVLPQKKGPPQIFDG